MSVFREVHPIVHYPFVPDPSGDKDEHGNPYGDLGPGVPRKAIAIYRKGTQEPVTVNEAARYVADLTMLVKKPELYGPRDEVEIDGRRFEVQAHGADGDWRKGPFGAKYDRLFGGQVELQRVG